ncbi:MAG: hypothetical protein ISS36_04115 [Candidatus Aenigmarchaeota archaeon]|nr:hypothetical protein [Candidatus Aenigmarchaeota archaeon]
MADIIIFMLELLCQKNALQHCQSFIQRQPDMLNQMIFLVFFPTIFLLIFVYFMSGAVVNEHKGLRLLLGIGIYLFIIFNGWYHIALIISEFWFVALIILGGIGIMVHRMSGGGRGYSSGAGRGLFSRIVGTVSQEATRKIEDKILKASGLMPKQRSVVKRVMKKLEKGEKLSGDDKTVLLTLVEQGAISSQDLRSLEAYGQQKKDGVKVKDGD